jgi:CheY-like chemotaxis protein
MRQILIIDDDAVMRRIFERTLTFAGYSVRSACDGREGIAMLHAAPADLIVTDIFMPNQEGLETIMEIRKSLPQVPIIAISGGYLASNSMLFIARQVGAVQVLKKPFKADTLVHAVQNVLGPTE